MKINELREIAERLLAHLPEYVVNGPMIFATPVQHVLKGIHFEGSDFDKASFYVWVFFLPMYVPTSRISFTLGKRILTPLHADRWNSNDHDFFDNLCIAVKEQGLSFLSRINSPLDAANAAATFSRNNPYVLQAIAYSLAWSGATNEAESALRQLLGQLNVEVGWRKQIADRAEILIEIICSRPHLVKRQLEAWELETLRNLDLARFANGFEN